MNVEVNTGTLTVAGGILAVIVAMAMKIGRYLNKQRVLEKHVGTLRRASHEHGNHLTAIITYLELPRKVKSYADESDQEEEEAQDG